MTPPQDENGKMYEFVNSGVYDALFVMEDVKTRSLWSHITGEAMYGEHAGDKMPVSNLLQMNITQALALDPTMQIAISDRPFGGEFQNPVVGELMTAFSDTLGTEDTRRDRMEMGLGVWTENGTYRFYPTEVIRDNNRIIIDELEGRTVLVYLDPVISVPVAVLLEADSATIDGANILLDGERIIQDSVLFDKDMNKLSFDKPQQVFTRWYGFSLSFGIENTEVYE